MTLEEESQKAFFEYNKILDKAKKEFDKQYRKVADKAELEYNNKIKSLQKSDLERQIMEKKK